MKMDALVQWQANTVVRLNKISSVPRHKLCLGGLCRTTSALLMGCSIVEGLRYQQAMVVSTIASAGQGPGTVEVLHEITDSW